MTSRERFIAALDRKPITGRVPHFELVFYLTMEAFGRVHPTHRAFHQWGQMSAAEQKLHIEDIADVYIQSAKRYEHSAIFVHGYPGGGEEDEFRLLDEIRRQSGDEYFLLMHGDSTYAIPTGEDMGEFCCRLYGDPDATCAEAKRLVDEYLAKGERYRKHGVLDGWGLCSDYCFNTGPFFSPDMFDLFVTPYLAELCKGYREQGYYVIKHTDGNIMPILDRLVDAEPHAIHSIDPQGGVDIAEVKKMVGDRVCLIGGVNCGLLDTGTAEECAESARYALKHGMPGGGYIFSTSNCVYTGMQLDRYELILDIWRKEGNYE